MNTLLTQIEQFLYRETRFLDERQWEQWLECYSPDVEYWMPAWGDDDQLTDDPQRQISLIYYPNRDGLEDRIYRIKTERSSASTPEPRTTHQISNVELLSQHGESLEVRYNWATFSHRYQQTEVYFGHVYCQLEQHQEQLRFRRKKIQLNNDYINHVIDIYHI